MANMRLIVNNAWDNAVLSADQEAMPITNTQGGKGVLREYPWRSTDATSQTIGGVFPEVDIDGIVINRANFTQSATVTAVLKLATVTVDTIVMTANGTDTWVEWITPAAADEIVITINDTANPAGYLQCVQVFLGSKIELDYNFEFNGQFSWPEDVEHHLTAGQSLRSSGTGISRRTASIDLRWLSDADRETLKTALLQYGRAQPLFASFYPGLGGTKETDHQFVCKRKDDYSNRHWSGAWWQTAIEFNEA